MCGHSYAYYIDFVIELEDKVSYVDTMEQPLKTRLSQRIARMRDDVFLRADFDDLGGYDQIGRGLRQLIRDGKLMKIGQGVYSRAVKSPFGDAVVPRKGLSTLTEALDRLGIKTMPSRLEQAYNAGRTTQVPTGRVVGVDRRVRRKLGYNGFSLSFERVRQAPR